ncbi:hypothetical protein [Serratia rubidaea]|uniref:hypothetical protein n=1 Tax=Serratia rubidaea TaxID=61652 RepID=UPI00234A559A|nr:hypothetical protein [Serratia rubidaea]MDC6111203.1 hypothetical protein [Serratia rubidaea]
MDIMTAYDYLLLDNAIGTVFNQDADIITGADTIEGMVDYFIANAYQPHMKNKMLVLLLDELNEFENNHSQNLDAAYQHRYPSDLHFAGGKEFFDIFREHIQKTLKRS